MAIDTEKSVAHPTTNFLLTPSRGACQHDAAKPKTLYLKPKDRRSRRFNTKDRRSGVLTLRIVVPGVLTLRIVVPGVLTLRIVVPGVLTKDRRPGVLTKDRRSRRSN